ncbi:MAG: FtsX-like permease family protein [Oscillospiraceae bacterium]|nr:FtsX-like permease family protein [Oscillospiraceae bacterium]
MSIFVMVALGVLFLVGLRSAAPDMRVTSDTYFDDVGLFDVQVISTLGLTDDDIAAFAGTDGIEKAEGGWSVDSDLVFGGDDLVVKAMGMSDKGFNTPTVVEGRLPTAKNECAIDKKLLTQLDISVGDTITLTPGEDMEDAFTDSAFTITGVVENPLYISLDRGTSTLGDGSTKGYVLLPRSSFALDYFTLCYISASGTKELDAYGDKYDDIIDDLTDRLKTAADDRADLRYETLTADARGEVSDAQQELDDAKKEADEKIADAEKELADSRRELNSGKSALKDAKAQLTDSKASGQAQLADGRAKLDAAWTELNASLDKLNESQEELDKQKESALAQLAPAKQQLDDSQAQLDAQQAQLDALEEQIETLKTQISDYEKALAAQGETGGTTYTYEELSSLRTALSTAQTQFASGQAAVDAAQKQLDANRETYNAQYASIASQFDEPQSQIDAGMEQYNSGLAELSEREAEYTASEKEYETGIADAEKQIADNEKKLRDGETAYAEGLADLKQAKTDAETEIADGQKKIDDAVEEIAGIKPATVYVLDRDSNYGFVSYDQNATRMENLAKMFPLIFFVVAALVCLTTMTRMIEEERTQIGTVKAMGYGTWSIAAKYLVYGIMAAVGGTIVGAIIGTTLIPWVIFTSYGIMYTLPKLQMHIYWPLCLGSALAGLACTVGAILWAMFETASASPAELMRPKAPKAGKRILLERVTPIWKRMSFSMKVSARNLFRYKKRFWMTVIGVAGCTALMIAGLGLRSSIFSIIDIQFNELYRYNAKIAVDTDIDGAADKVMEKLAEMNKVETYVGENTKSDTFCFGDNQADAYLTVTDDPDALAEQIVFRDMDNGEPLEVRDGGIIIDEKLSEMLGVSVGDKVTIDIGDGDTAQIPVAGITEQYVYHYGYMTANTFEKLFDREYTPNEILVTTSVKSEDEISSMCRQMMAIPEVLSATNLRSTAYSFRSTMQVVNAAVMIIILSAAMLAFVVLYNLTNINITERMRELATIKVLGFYDTEVAMYIYRENIVLTLIGILLGQLAGKFLCQYLIRTVEMDIVMFGRHALLQNYLMSVLLSLIFAAAVNLFMYFKMKKIDMVQSLKSVE